MDNYIPDKFEILEGENIRLKDQLFELESKVEQLKAANTYIRTNLRLY